MTMSNDTPRRSTIMHIYCMFGQRYRLQLRSEPNHLLYHSSLGSCQICWEPCKVLLIRNTLPILRKRNPHSESDLSLTRQFGLEYETQATHACRSEYTHLLSLRCTGRDVSIGHGLHLQLLRLRISAVSASTNNAAYLWYRNLQVDSLNILASTESSEDLDHSRLSRRYLWRQGNLEPVLVVCWIALQL